MPERPPEQGPLFEAMMSEIDAKLKAEGVDIPSRPMMAVGEVAKKYRLSIPLGGPSAELPPDLRENYALSESIKLWYDSNYGDKLKTNPCPCNTVVSLDGDLYELRVPRIFGSVQFIVHREWSPNPGIQRGPVTCNIVQLVDGMTPAKAARLSNAALDQIGLAFQRAVPAAFTLEGTDHPLMAIALGDVETAVSNLMVRGGRYGESKWASLQAAEKVLKAAIDLAGIKFKFTHGLSELCQTLKGSGLVFDTSKQITAIQCKPGIRYGEEACSREEALAAHQASLELVNILREAGANFNMSIGGFRSSS